MGLQLVRLTREATYGTFVGASPPTGTQFDIFLPTDDAMSVRVDPKFWMVRDAGQGNRLVKKSVGRREVTGALNTFLFPSQTPFLLGLAAGLAGTPPCLHLPSFTIDNIIYADNGCATFGKRYLGCLFADAMLSCDDSDQGTLVNFKGSIVGSKAATITLTDFPSPSLSAYPADDPFQLYHTAENTGQFTVGAVRHNYKSLSISIKNMVKQFGGEVRFTNLVGYFGRDVSVSTKLLFTTQADRDAFEAGTKEAVSILFDNGTSTCLLDFGANVNIDSVADSFPLGDYFTQSLSFSSLMDPARSPATDLTITTTP